MTIVKPSFLNWLSYLILTPIMAMLFLFLFFGQEWYMHQIYWQVFGYMLTMGLVPWYLDVWAFYIIQRFAPALHQTAKRLRLLLVKKLFSSGILAILFIPGTDYLFPEIYNANKPDFWICFLIGFAITSISTFYREGDYILKQWKRSLAEQEKYKQLTLQHEFEVLKNQVNPNFLYNCFIALSSLIKKDKQNAEYFLNQLSKVYRYLLRNNEDGLSALKNEILFIESYFRLLQTVYGKSIHITYDIDQKLEDYLLPSQSLQMLVENAINHHSSKTFYSIEITIFTNTKEQVLVRSNLNTFVPEISSRNSGLKNIAEKYKLLKLDGFEIKMEPASLTVILPLLQSKALQNQIQIH